MFVVAASLCTVGVFTGVLYGESRITLSTVVAAGAALIIVALWPELSRAHRNRPNPARPEQQDRLGRVNVLIGTATALIAVLGLLLPAMPNSAAEAGC